jgi:hypothetical protein
MNRRQLISTSAATAIALAFFKNNIAHAEASADSGRADGGTSPLNDVPFDNLPSGKWVDENGTVFAYSPLPPVRYAHDYEFVAYPYLERDGPVFEPFIIRGEYTAYLEHMVGFENMCDQIRSDIQEFVSWYYKAQESGKLKRCS